MEMLVLRHAGTLSVEGPHLHATVSDAHGEVRTKAEVVIGLLPEWEFGRAVDPRTGYSELVVRCVA